MIQLTPEEGWKLQALGLRVQSAKIQAVQLVQIAQRAYAEHVDALAQKYRFDAKAPHTFNDEAMTLTPKGKRE